MLRALKEPLHVEELAVESPHVGKIEVKVAAAEDLGLITTDVVELRRRLGLPGMRVLQFAWDGNPRQRAQVSQL